MNLNQITPGIDYAYFPYRGKQEEFRWNRQDSNYWRLTKYGVFRVKAIRTYSEREIGKTRDTGYVDCFWLDEEGEFRLDENDNHIIKKIPVRHVATIWDDYADELDHQTVIRDNREREQEERRERERIRQQEELRKKQYIKTVELHYGLPEGSVKQDDYSNALILNREMIDEQLQYDRRELDGETSVR